MITIFLKVLYIMGYNLKNARNGNSISKTSKLPGSKSLALKSKLIRQFEFFEMMLGSKALLSSNFLHTNLLSFLKLQTVIKSHSLMPGALNLAIWMFSACFFHFWHNSWEKALGTRLLLAFLKLQPIILWKVGHVMT